jgi:undecaprenyl-diphosphatase
MALRMLAPRTPARPTTALAPSRRVRAAWLIGRSAVLVVAAGLLFAGLAQALGAHGDFEYADRLLSEELRTAASAGARQSLGWLTRLGDGRALTLLTLAGVGWLLMRGERALAIGLVVATAGNGLLNALLKHSFARERPLLEAGAAGFHGWGFPSGHASGTLVAYGMLAYLLLRLVDGPRRWAALPLVVAVVLAVGASRVVLGAHYVSDVAAGFASGTVWLTGCIVALELWRQRMPRG